MPTPRTTQPPGSGSKPKPTLEIIPDQRFIVFHGTEHEAAPVTLTGRVRLTAPEAMSILKPKIRLEGKRKIKWYAYHTYGANSRGVAEKKTVFHNQELKLGPDTPHKVKEGVMEWSFAFELTPAMPESVEGLKESYVAYHLCAGVSRPGWNSKDILAQEHIRIVRTLGPEAMSMTRERVNSDVWVNKMSYCISIPSDAIVFGTSIIAEVQLSPIKKGLKMGKVELRLLETVIKRIEYGEGENRPDATNTEEKEVARTDMDFPEHSRVTYEDETVDSPVLADEMYRFNAVLPLPQTLNQCRQDVDFHMLTITHRFKLMVNIHNPEGHTSQLVCRLPVRLFISPNLPVNEMNEIDHVPGRPTDAELNSNETTLTAPPEYGRHQLDAIYSDIDLSSFMSRAGSASGTPSGLFAQSRRASSTNLHAMSEHGSATPQQLRERLAGLTMQDGGDGGSDTPGGHRTPTVSFALSSHSGSAPRSIPISRNSSGIFASQWSRGSTPPNGTSTILHHRSPHSSASASRRTSDEVADDDQPATTTTTLSSSPYDLDDLSRVPSYGAALRTPGATTPLTDGPPSYSHAVGAAPTPPANGDPIVPAAPPSASAPPSRPPPPPPPPLSRGHTPRPPGVDPSPDEQDEQARLRNLRARG